MFYSGMLINHYVGSRRAVYCIYIIIIYKHNLIRNERVLGGGCCMCVSVCVLVNFILIVLQLKLRRLIKK